MIICREKKMVTLPVATELEYHPWIKEGEQKKKVGSLLLKNKLNCSLTFLQSGLKSKRLNTCQVFVVAFFLLVTRTFKRKKKEKKKRAFLSFNILHMCARVMLFSWSRVSRLCRGCMHGY